MSKSFIKISCLILFIIGVVSCIAVTCIVAVKVKNKRQEIVSNKFDVSYGNDENQRYDFYAPVEEADTLIIIVHGGAWILGDKNQFTLTSLFFAHEGFSVINLDYRLAPKWQYDAPLRDITTILNLVAENPQQFKLKNNYKVALIGHSAGAHLTSLYALKEEFYEQKNIDYAVGLAGPYDLKVIEDKPGKILVKGALYNFLGDTSLEDASPVNQVKDGEKTKFLLVLGKEDELVSEEQLQNFKQALENKNVFVKTELIDNRDHNTLISMIPTDDKTAELILSFISE